MGQAGDQGSEGDEENGRKEHMGAADWTGARVGGEQLVPLQGTVVVDLLETLGTEHTSGSQGQEQVSWLNIVPLPCAGPRQEHQLQF